MKVLYTRISTASQNPSRQNYNNKDYDHVIEDVCSGSVALFDRCGGSELKKLINKGVSFSLHVHTIDRLGRNLQDILTSIQYFTDNKISIHFITQGLTTLDDSGNEVATCKLMIGILGTVAEMERSQIRERQMEGIKIAKLKGVFLGRKKGTSEDALKFLSKPKNQKVVEYLKKGYSHSEISKIININMNTITKIKKACII